MSNSFSETIDKIIYAKSIDDASNALYGKNGLNIDYHSYYEKLIASFGMKTQSIIIKKGNTLNFDIERNKKDLWNVIFIGQLLYEKILAQYNQKLNDSTISKEESKSILENIRNLQDRISEANIIVPINISLSPTQINEFKMFVTLIQKIKDSTMHINGTNKYEFDFDKKVFIISNDGGRFNLPKIEIPLEYIEGFVNSFIIPQHSDANKGNDVDRFVFPILQSLNFDPKNLTNFFYRVDPSKLDYLLNILGNDIALLYKLNPFVFNCSIQFIKNLLNSNNNDIKILCDLPNNAYIHEENTTNYLNAFGIKKIYQLPNSAFAEPELINEMIKKYGIDILDELNSWEIFNANETSIHSFNNHDDYSLVEGFVELSKKYKKNIIKGFPPHAYKYYSVTEDILESNKNTSLINNLPEVAFENLRHIKISYTTIIGAGGSKDMPEYTNMKKLINSYDIEVIKRIPEYAFKYPGAILYILEHYGIENLEILPIECFINPYSTHEVLQYVKNHKINEDTLVDNEKVKEVADDQIENVIKIIENDTTMSQDDKAKIIDTIIKEHKIVLREKITYPKFSQKVFNRILKYSKYPKAFNFYLNKYGSEKSIQILDNIPEWGLKHFYQSFKLLSKYGLDTIKKIPNISLETTRLRKNTILGDTVTGDVKFPKGTLTFLKKHKNNIQYFPENFFYYPKGTDYLLSFYNYNSIINLPIYAFRESKKTKILIDKYGIDIIQALPEFVFSEKNNLDCINNVMELVNGDIKKIKELPDEFFKCHDEEILNSLYNNYNKVITQSIFNTKNPKIIALIIYAKKILPHWDYNVVNANKDLRIQLSNINFNGLDLLELQNFIEADTIQNKLDGNASFPINNKYCNMLNGIINNGKEQVIIAKRDEFESNIRDKIGLFLNNEVIRPLRNAESHFRFSDVYDNNGTIIDDKVRIFDINENGTITHDKIYDINAIYESVKQIDLFMKGNIMDKDFQTIFDDLNIGNNMPLTSAIHNYIPMVNQVNQSMLKK